MIDDGLDIRFRAVCDYCLLADDLSIAGTRGPLNLTALITPSVEARSLSASAASRSTLSMACSSSLLTSL
jgi:hypothetical protein